MSQLTAQQVYNLARSAGFDAEHARTMTAIAQRESSFRPDVVGTISPLERSYGLWQINTKDPVVWAKIQQATGITNPEDLKIPEINAKAAYALYDGSDRNIEIAWATNRDGVIPWATRFRQFLNNLPPISTLEGSFNPSSNEVAASPLLPSSGDSNDSALLANEESPSASLDVLTPFLILVGAVGLGLLLSKQ